ncbi:MAG: FtsX-like permease family protein, partial [Bacteroidota bacterium]
FDKLPDNSTIQFDVAVSYDLLADADHYAYEWSGGYAQTYVVMHEETNIDDFNQKIKHYLKSKHEGAWGPSEQFLQKFSDRYLHGTFEEGVLVGGRIEYVRLFSLIGLFILLIACINFMNLATARASKKMKEIGVKKVVGASRRILVGQFLFESVLLVLISTGFAIGLVAFLLPNFNQLTGKTLTMDFGWEIMTALGVISLLTGIISGSYPAFYLSGFQPVKVLKGKLQNSKGEIRLREALVVFQFAISVVFIASVFVVNQQMAYTQERNLGYSRDQVISFERPFEHRDLQAFLGAVRSQAGVLKASSSVLYFLDGQDSNGGFSWTGDASEGDYLFQSPMVSYDFVETLGMELVAGRSFSQERQDDYTKIVLNESAVKMMGLENPVGTVIKKGDEQREIIGVVKDFQYGSIHEKVEPLIFRHRNFGRNILVKVAAGNEKASLEALQKVYAEFHPHYPFVYTFMDEDYQKLYESEQRVAVLSKYFSLLAIIISCLGLLGLAAYMTERRTKEIGIRKVLGAGNWEMMRLLSADFTKMVLIAIIIATPFSIWLLRSWLDNFAYRIELSWMYFVGAALITLLVAWFTVGLQAFKTVNLKPANCLRDE